jgi:hypothetical protein
VICPVTHYETAEQSGLQISSEDRIARARGSSLCPSPWSWFLLEKLVVDQLLPALRKPKVHYHLQKWSPIVVILSYMHPVHILVSCPLKVQLNFALSEFSLRFCHLACNFLLSHVCYIIIMVLQSFLGLGRFFGFLILNTVGRTPWTGDQPITRPLPTHRINAHGTDIHVLGGIGIHDLSVRASEDKARPLWPACCNRSTVEH